MSSDIVLVFAWLIFAHLVADFVLQTDAMVSDKRSSGRRAWRGLATHGAVVGLCTAPVVAIFGPRGLLLLGIVPLGHVVIDRWKVRATRHAEARALLLAHRRHERPNDEPGETLGPAWTPVPAALFVVDQVLHLGLILAAAYLLVARLGPLPEWTMLVDRLLGGVDRGLVHRSILLAVVGASLVIVNVRAGALFVATLVRPRETPPGATPAPVEPVEPDAPLPAAWRIRLGPLQAVALPSRTATPGVQSPAPSGGHASTARIGATIGILERLLIVTFVLTGSTAAIGFVVAAKTLARFKQLDDRDFAEYYLLGTLASVAVALGSALVAQAALATLSWLA